MSEDGHSAKRARYAADARPEWLQQLEEQGYAVVDNVLTEGECARLRVDFDAYMRACGVPANPRLRDLPDGSPHGIIQCAIEIGHAPFAWNVRTHPRVVGVFEQLYGTNDLLTSFDGACYMPADYYGSGRLWTHVDQSHRKAGRRCVQGYVNLGDSRDAHCGSLGVVPGSHLRHSAFAAQFGTGSAKDWRKFGTDEERAFMERGKLTRVHGGVGSLVLWDSRTAHQNMCPVRPQAGETTRVRRVVYTCFQPRAWCSAANLRKKQKAFAEYRMTTHWPASKIELFGKRGRTYGQPRVEYTPPRTRDAEAERPERMRELAGVAPLASEPLRRGEPGLEFVH